MKYRNMLPFVALSVLILTSCDDNKMEWYKDPTHGAVTSSELPLQLAEKISRYKPLKEYLSDPNFKLGIGVGMDEYLGDETTTTIVNENFNDLTIGYAMKHGPMVDSKGNLKFDKVDQLFTKTTEAGISIYGHCLIWHTNQNASYLNSLIAPEVIPGPAGTNLLQNGSFDEDIVPWASWGGGKATVEHSATEGLGNTKGCIKAVTSASSAKPWDLEIQSEAIPVIEGHRYQISFFIKSEGVGAVRLAFEGMNTTYPNIDGKETIPTSNSWQQIVYNKELIGTDIMPAENSDKLQFRIDLGAVANMTYYIDDIVVVDLEGEPTVVNLISNGDFESGTIDPWNSWGNGSSRDISEEGEGVNGSKYAMKLTNPAAGDQIHVAQACYTLAAPLVEGTQYKVSAWVKSTVSNGKIQMQVQDNADFSGPKDVTNTWNLIEWTITAKAGGHTKLLFDFGLVAADYYIDDIVLEEIETTRAVIRASGPTIIEKTDEEKAKIIRDAMEDWISKMVTHCKPYVHAWDVVNEPMDDGKTSDIKSGKGKTDLASDEFYWQDYFLTPKDYAVEAFKLARLYGNPDDKLFINDYNLEYNLNKCDGLIKYVEYIESKGATVDGIGTQMHIAIDSNKDNIAQMFQKLGATGKLIKVSELDIKVNTSSPTTENLAQQAEMYQYVIDMYKKYIPADKQYGITIWGVSDNEKEHVNWIPDDAPNLWDANYARKHAYKGVADGLAGKDVSEDFTGDLE
ncbi:endo-1,4-beta-xylanase [Bacteroides zhangwenhongii]|uniref:endo-1,4-beta-xylanase n=1 Tax=Bacteroides zhangwenhongii TaxID=2650157 RepID=UPI003AB0B41A